MKRLMTGILAGLASIVLSIGAILYTGLNDKVANADMIVVPGNAIARDGTPSPRLKSRLDAALTLFHEHRAPLIFVSGGTGKEGYDEALSMSDYLLKNGVPKSSIVTDNLGVDTEATARNAATFMRAHNLKSALVATQYFHIARTKLALERNGVQVAGNTHARYFEMRDLYSTPREVAAYVLYFLRS